MNKHLFLNLLATTCLSSLAFAESAPTLSHKIAVAPQTKKTFQGSDGITIDEITGTAADLRVGETYRVKGVCRQHTLSNAQLYLGNTSSGSGAITAAPGSTNSLKLERGDTPFDFTFTLHQPGVLHVTIYDLDNHDPNDNAYAGLILGPVSGSAEAKESASPAGTVATANDAIFAYLGQPVPAPAGLDDKFRAQTVFAAFTSLCTKAGYTIKNLAVDETEFPFLVYGRIVGKKDISGFTKELEGLKPYVYGGSVNGNTSATDETYFALNLTPSDRYPDASAQACNRRLMIRLQMLASRANGD